MFEWDINKAELNKEKHGIDFESATTVFLDSNALDGPDIAHSTNEQRFIRIGTSIKKEVLVVVYTYRRNNNGESKIRIISARKASRKEKKAYEE